VILTVSIKYFRVMTLTFWSRSWP